MGLAGGPSPGQLPPPRWGLCAQLAPQGWWSARAEAAVWPGPEKGRGGISPPACSLASTCCPQVEGAEGWGQPAPRGRGLALGEGRLCGPWQARFLLWVSFLREGPRRGTG